KIVKIAYKSHLFEGTPEELLPKLKSIQKENNFKSIMRIPLIRDQVVSLYTNIEQQKETPRVFKQVALNYLKYVYRNNRFLNTYHKLVYKGIAQLRRNAMKYDAKVKEEYEFALAKLSSPKIPSAQDQKQVEIKRKQLLAHQWMQEQIALLDLNKVQKDLGELAKFKETYLAKIFEMLENESTNEEIFAFLEVSLADWYHQAKLNRIEKSDTYSKM
ncbi:MAG: hypothetical protein OIF50_06505, partial [Flavobacteriaceae bacterium]|nr:hypothetical protein [Flavobacteriaceae bacterium]